MCGARRARAPHIRPFEGIFPSIWRMCGKGPGSSPHFCQIEGLCATEAASPPVIRGCFRTSENISPTFSILKLKLPSSVAHFDVVCPVGDRGLLADLEFKMEKVGHRACGPLLRAFRADFAVQCAQEVTVALPRVTFLLHLCSSDTCWVSLR